MPNAASQSERPRPHVREAANRFSALEMIRKDHFAAFGGQASRTDLSAERRKPKQAAALARRSRARPFNMVLICSKTCAEKIGETR